MNIQDTLLQIRELERAPLLRAIGEMEEEINRLRKIIKHQAELLEESKPKESA